MFLCSFIEELCTKKENNETCCSFNFEHKCIILKTMIFVENASIMSTGSWMDVKNNAY